MSLVTILILIDGFLQYEYNLYIDPYGDCHNPYFNRWFSAIIITLKENFNDELSQSLF